MKPFELIEMIKKDKPAKEVIAILNELLYELHINQRKFTMELEEEICEFADSNSICPSCGSELNVVEYNEYRGEYQGFDCNEKMCYIECVNSECSYTSS